MNPFGEQNFVIGCNYWASHAGTDMWRNWRCEVIEEDFRRLESLHLEVVRIFPLWPDFQPLVRFSGSGNQPLQLRWRDGGEIPVDTDGRTSGVDPEMLERFRWVCDCALRHNLQLGIGLVTGWMSGRMFTPPAFEGCNPLLDAPAIRWQLKLVKRVVTSVKDHPAIAFWGIGNECNCMGPANRHEGALWAQTIADAIRAADPTRPIAAGLHSLVPTAAGAMAPTPRWSIGDMAEIFDALTVHPYPPFTPHTEVDRITGIKNVFHATAEAHFYGDIGRRPCIAEELGTLAPTVAGEASAAAYLRNTLFNLWSHDCEGLLWWCAFDQLHLSQPPYQWCAVERMLGLFHDDGSPKPVGGVLKEFAEFRERLPFRRLPRFQCDAVCVLSEDQDCWMAAFGAWTLAKQAGFDLEFQFADEPLRPSDFYIVPAQAGLNNLPRDRYLALMERVAAGATLYYSFDGACLAPFDEFFGLTTEYREVFPGTAAVEIDGDALPFDFTTRITTQSCGAEVLLRGADGRIVLSRHRYGAGEAYFLTYAPEKQIVTRNGAAERPYYKLYREAARKILERRAFRTNDPRLTVTLHHAAPNLAYAVIVNNADTKLAVTAPAFAAGWRRGRVLYGNPDAILAHSAAVIELETTARK